MIHSASCARGYILAYMLFVVLSFAAIANCVLQIIINRAQRGALPLLQRQVVLTD